MQRFPILSALLCCAAVSPLLTGADKDATSTKSIATPAERGTLETLAQSVRGDTGKWRDEAMLQVVPSPAEKQEKFSLDDWADRWLDTEAKLTPEGDTWLLFRTRQLDDNDRVWVEKIERTGNRFQVTLHQAIWQGNYWKSFTYYQVIAVNLGKLPSGSYEAKWTIHPLTFTQFENPARIQTSRSKDEKPAGKTDGETLSFEARFTVNAP